MSWYQSLRDLRVNTGSNYSFHGSYSYMDT